MLVTSVHLLASIVGIALLVNRRATILERLGVGDRGLLLVKEADEGAHVVLLNVLLALLIGQHGDILLCHGVVSVCLARWCNFVVGGLC